MGVKRDAVKYYNIEEPAASTHKRSRSSVPDAAGDGATEVKAPVKKPETMEEKLQAKQDLLRHRLEKDPKAFSRFKPNEASVALKQMTVKEKEHEKRLKGQSTHARYTFLESCICDWVRSCLNTSCCALFGWVYGVTGGRPRKRCNSDSSSIDHAGDKPDCIRHDRYWFRVGCPGLSLCSGHYTCRRRRKWLVSRQSTLHRDFRLTDFRERVCFTLPLCQSAMP